MAPVVCGLDEENYSGMTQWRKAIKCINVNIVLPTACGADRLHKLMSNNCDRVIIFAMNERIDNGVETERYPQIDNTLSKLTFSLPIR